MFNYPREYVQLPWGVCSTTLGSVFNYPGECVQLPSGVCLTTLGIMFNYPEECVQLSWGVCSATLVELGVSVELGGGRVVEPTPQGS